MESSRETISHPVSVSEAFFLLEQQKNRYKNIRSESYQLFKKTLDYTESFGRIKDKSVVEDLRTFLADFGFSEDEIAVVGSLLPQSVEDAKIYVPSIARLGDENILSVIQKIQRIY